MWSQVLAVCVLFVQAHSSPLNIIHTGKRAVGSRAFEEENVHDKIVKINIAADANKYEGDIDLPKNRPASADLSSDGDVDGELSMRTKRNAVRDRKKLWTNRIVPYKYGDDLPSEYHVTIQQAIEEYHNKTCIRFKQRTNEKNYIVFVHRRGCWSAVGRSYWLYGIGQEISLGSGCNEKTTIMHEMMHAVGFWHEQSRPDRNQYVEILWENIEKGESYNFNKYSHGEIDTLSIPYDYDSIMHYSTRSFSMNGKPTIRAIRTPNRELGQRDGFTELDVREINALYDCKSAGTPWSVWSEYGPCDLDCYKYKQRFCSSSNPADCPGADMYGVQTDIVKCTKQECYAPVHGHWGRWSAWGTCNKSCGLGTHTRTRRCDDPKPRHGGKNCSGSDTDNESCKVKSCGLGPDDCEFDADMMCNWKNSDKNPEMYRWERLQGPTPTGGTGPDGDHTSGSGHYIYTEGSAPNQAGFKSVLVSRTLNRTEGRCLSFWYHMLGEGMGSLNVYIESAAGSRTSIWSASGNQGKAWKLGHATVTSDTDHKVLFESVRGADFRSDIGLDDIRIDNGPCLEAIGCYRDSSGNRTLPQMYANLRPQIDWFNIKATIRKCALLALKSGYKVFGVQFYGECWGSSKNDGSYAKYGAWPDGCWSGVGGGFANFVYKIT